MEKMQFSHFGIRKSYTSEFIWWRFKPIMEYLCKIFKRGDSFKSNYLETLYQLSLGQLHVQETYWYWEERNIP